MAAAVCIRLKLLGGSKRLAAIAGAAGSGRYRRRRRPLRFPICEPKPHNERRVERRSQSCGGARDSRVHQQQRRAEDCGAVPPGSERRVSGHPRGGGRTPQSRIGRSGCAGEIGAAGTRRPTGSGAIAAGTSPSRTNVARDACVVGARRERVGCRRRLVACAGALGSRRRGASQRDRIETRNRRRRGCARTRCLGLRYAAGMTRCRVRAGRTTRR